MPAKSVESYIASFPPAMRQRLNLVRSTIRKVLPKADESISYGIVGYKVEGRPIVYFGGFSKHYSLFGGTNELREMLGERLAPYLGGKGTIQFPATLPVPVALIRDVARLRLQNVTSERAAKPKGKSADSKGGKTSVTKALGKRAKKSARRNR